MKISRRTVLAASASAPFLVPGRASAASATIHIHSGRHRGEIDKKIFGNFIEHLGRCITGGIFEEGSPLSDKEGFRKDVMNAVQEMGVPFLRWPGGNFSSNYNWRDGIGPRDKRPPRLEMAWGTVEDNRFGTHEFMDYVEKIGSEPYICMNLGTGSWVEAQQWVEYVNGTQDTEITRLRRKNGRDKPWKVKYWGLGNEMDGYWQMGHRSASDYGAFALEAANTVLREIFMPLPDLVLLSLRLLLREITLQRAPASSHTQYDRLDGRAEDRDRQIYSDKSW